MIISRTPFRISFFGGGTDYPVWFREHGGAVLATTIDKYCYISCRQLPPFFEHRTRIAYSRIELVNNNQEIEHPAVRGVLKYLNIDDGLEIHHDGDLPARTGLGSSSSFTVGLLHTLYALQHIMPSKAQLAQAAIHVEQDVLGEAVGCQDQVLAAHGGLCKATFFQNGDIGHAPVIMRPERLAAFQSHLQLYFTGFSRIASEVAREQIDRSRIVAAGHSYGANTALLAAPQLPAWEADAEAVLKAFAAGQAAPATAPTAPPAPPAPGRSFWK